MKRNALEEQNHRLNVINGGNLFKSSSNIKQNFAPNESSKVKQNFAPSISGQNIETRPKSNGTTILQGYNFKNLFAKEYFDERHYKKSEQKNSSKILITNDVLKELSSQGKSIEDLKNLIASGEYSPYNFKTDYAKHLKVFGKRLPLNISENTQKMIDDRFSHSLKLLNYMISNNACNIRQAVQIVNYINEKRASVGLAEEFFAKKGYPTLEEISRDYFVMHERYKKSYYDSIAKGRSLSLEDSQIKELNKVKAYSNYELEQLRELKNLGASSIHIELVERLLQAGYNFNQIEDCMLVNGLPLVDTHRSDLKACNKKETANCSNPYEENRPNFSDNSCFEEVEGVSVKGMFLTLMKNARKFAGLDKSKENAKMTSSESENIKNKDNVESPCEAKIEESKVSLDETKQSIIPCEIFNGNYRCEDKTKIRKILSKNHLGETEKSLQHCEEEIPKEREEAESKEVTLNNDLNRMPYGNETEVRGEEFFNPYRVLACLGRDNSIIKYAMESYKNNVEEQSY